MPPRRKRTVLDDSDSEEEHAHEQRKTSLRHWFSPNAKAAATGASIAVFASPTKTTTAAPAPTTPGIARRTRSAAKTPTKADPISVSSPSQSSPFGRVLSSRTSDTNGGGRGAAHGKSPCPSPSPSPEKRRGTRSLKLADEKGKSADLVALFSKQAERALASPPKRSTGAASARDRDAVVDRILSDDDIEDDDIAESSATTASYVGGHAQKRWKMAASTRLTASQQLPVPTRNAMPPPPLSQPLSLPASQRFKRPTQTQAATGLAADAAPGPANDNDARPWSERFAPVNLDELAVHKRKVADVRRWLDDVLGGRSRQRLLVLKGAAGTGKTTTMRLLAKDMGLDVLEWKNPSGISSAGLTSHVFSSAAAQFDEFLNRGCRFGQLDLEGDGSDSDGASPASPAKPTATRQKIVVIEEFPNTFTKSSSALTGFRSSVLQYLAANTPSLTAYAQRRATSEPQTISPIIMIVSETLLTTTSASADSFTAHRLLGPDILRHPGTFMIEFNVIAPSLLAKALELVVQKEARKSGRRRTPGPLVLKRLGEVGDVRSAIASLEFFCVKGDDAGDWGAKVAFSKTRRGPKDAALTKGERETLEMVSQREASLGVFHAVGKVVYNKRDDLAPPAGSEAALAETLPGFLAHHARPKASLVGVDALIDETGTDTATFISALHENYALSCEQTGPADPMSSVDYVNGCIEYLSESDLLCPTYDVFFGGRGAHRGGAGSFGRDTGSHVLRQDEMAFQVAVRGLLFSLPSPVKRSSGSSFSRGDGSSGGNGSAAGNQFKMFYPMYLKLWRTREEMEALVDVWCTKLLRGEVAYGGASSSASSSAGGATGAPLGNGAGRAMAFRRPPKFHSNGATAANDPGGFHGRKAPFATIREEDEAKAPTVGGPVRAVTSSDDKEKDESVPLLSLGSAARKEMILERLPYMALIGRGRRCSFGSLGLRDLEKVVAFQGIGAVAAATAAEEAEDDVADAAAGAGTGVGDDAWATDRPTDEASPRKTRPTRRPAPRATTNPYGRKTADTDDADTLPTLPMYSLVLSDDDIEDDDD